MTGIGEQMNSACPRCGGPFICGSVAGTPNCWCAGFPVLQGVSREAAPQAQAADASCTSRASCYCPACLRELLVAQVTQAAQAAQSNPD